MHTPAAVLDGRAIRVSRYEPTKMLGLAIVLTPPHPEEERQFLEDVQDKGSEQFHQFLSAEDWNARFAPSAEDEQAVVDWATSQGLTVKHRYPNRLLVDVEAQAATIEKALHVTINNYRVPGEGDEAEPDIRFSNDRDPVLPQELRAVESVLGLNSFEFMTPGTSHGRRTALPDYVSAPLVQDGGSLRADVRGDDEPASMDTALPRPEIQPVPKGYLTPSYFWASTAYDYQALMNLGHCCNPLNNPERSPKETSIAIAAFGDVAFADLTAFATSFKLAPSVQKYRIDGTYVCNSTTPGGDNNCIETTLDTEWAMATANSLKTQINTAGIYVYEGNGPGIQTTADVYMVILNDNRTRIMNDSWGCPENPSSGTNGCTADTMKAHDHILSQMVGEGWTLVSATGDQGAVMGCGNALHVGFPASDPNVVAVGGTILNEGTVDSKYEVAWTGSTTTGACAKNNGGSTGGFSEWWGVVGYQEYLKFAKRGVPDISLATNTSHAVYVFGNWAAYGGTSIAGPKMAGFFAQENAYLLALGNKCGPKGVSPCAPLGNANYPLYQIARYRNTAHYPFYDIESGCNSNDITALYKLTPFCASIGFDEVTGLGAANMLQLAWGINWILGTANGVPYVTFTGPTTMASKTTPKWYHTNQVVRWKVNDYAGGVAGVPGMGIAGFTQGWDSIPADNGEESHGGPAGNLFYDGPEFPNGTTGCLSLTGAEGCGGGVGQGCHFVFVHGWNNQGETTAGQAYLEHYGPVCYDTVAPIVEPSIASPPNNQGWYNVPVTLKFTSWDPGGAKASGVGLVSYGINDQCSKLLPQSCLVYKTPLQFTKDGVYTVRFYAEDKAGNFSSAYQQPVNVDQTPPVTTATLSGTLSGTNYTSAVSITIAATDNLSRVKNTYYELDGGAQTTYNGATSKPTPILVSALGSHTLKYWSIDNAGNTEAAKMQAFTLANGTVTTLTVSPNPAADGQNVILSAAVTSSAGTPTGTVQFLNGTTSMAIITLVNGKAALSNMSLPVGTAQFTAVYQGTTGFPASTSAVVNEVIQSTYYTSATMISTPNPAIFGSPVKFTAAIYVPAGGLPPGTVTFFDGTTALGTVPAGESVSFTTSALTVGSHSITAAYSGATGYLPCTSPVLTEVVNAAAQTNVPTGMK